MSKDKMPKQWVGITVMTVVVLALLATPGGLMALAGKIAGGVR